MHLHRAASSVKGRLQGGKMCKVGVLARWGKLARSFLGSLNLSKVHAPSHLGENVGMELQSGVHSTPIHKRVVLPCPGITTPCLTSRANYCQLGVPPPTFTMGCLTSLFCSTSLVLAFHFQSHILPLQLEQGVSPTFTVGHVLLLLH